MDIISDLSCIHGAVSCTLGSFDGVHRGHMELLKACQSKGLFSSAVTFRQHPISVLNPAMTPGLLTTSEEREEWIRVSGIQYLVEMEFTRQTAEMPAEIFLKDLCNRTDIRRIIVGYNYTFGAGGQGNADLLIKMSKTLGYEAVVIPPVCYEGQPISSSRIREALTAGRAEEANSMLGHPYRLGGLIIRGKQLGRTIGFPTVNLRYSKDKIIPASGVYAGWLSWEGHTVPALGNLGTNPTVEDKAEIKLEVHALEKIPLNYGDQAFFLFGKHLRGEFRYSSLDALIQAMTHDRTEAELWLRQHCPEKNI